MYFSDTLNCAKGNFEKMKKLISLITLSLCLLLVFGASAQMDKKEAKEWKKRIKKLEPEEFKQILDENKSLKGQVASLKSELGSVDSKLSEKDQQILAYQQQVGDAKKQLSKTQNQVSRNTPRSNSTGSIDENNGVVFKVQIGAYRKKNLAKYKNSPNFGIEQEGDVQKYTVGVFREYWDADTFKKYLREMGVKDAFVVSYRNGSRIPIKDVLERSN